MALPQVVLPTYELEIPSNGKTIKYRPFVVKEEKLLLLAMESQDDKQIEDAVRTLLKGCIQSRVKLEDLAIFDLEYIFLNIRAASVGEVVEMNITCQDDGETQVKYNLNLTEVKVQKPEGHNNKIMLSDEMGIMMKYPAFDDFVRSSIIGAAPSADGVIEIVAGCIDQIFDKEDVYDSSTTSKKEFVEFLEGLTNNQFEEIQKFFETAPKLEHTIKIKNPKTGVENDVVISGLANFFG
ncbi:base plate hub subunit [Synechococcus phage S-RSM4]|uniref:Base plate hub subunit n=2 Tax=root TaxID=1 RepID=C7BVJ8_9CAUD|nr:baseplate hub [Synechococcus phage S-RSM4]CAR63427.1 base plate hub subunit [Synechococcus phage S-RSM4]